MLFSKSPVKDISQKIKPPQASIKNLKFERKKDFDSFLTYIKREAKALDDIKLPKISEVKRKPFPVIGALLGLGFLGSGGLLSGLAPEDDSGDGLTSKDSDFKLPSLSLAAMKAYSERGKGKDKKKKGDGDKPPSGVTDGTGAKKVARESKYQQNRLKKIRNRILNIKKKRYTTKTKGAIELKGEALLRQQKLENRMEKAYNRNRKQFPIQLTKREKAIINIGREEGKRIQINKLLPDIADDVRFGAAEKDFEDTMGFSPAQRNKKIGNKKVSVTKSRAFAIGTGDATVTYGGSGDSFGGSSVTFGDGGKKNKGSGSVTIGMGGEDFKIGDSDMKKSREAETKLRKLYGEGGKLDRMEKAYNRNRRRFPKKIKTGGGFPYSTFRMSDEGRNFKKTFMDFYKVKNNTLRVLSFMSGLMGGSPKLTLIRMLVETSINDLLYNPVADGTMEAQIEMMEANREAQIENLSKLILSGEIDVPDTGFGEYTSDAFATPPSFQFPMGGSNIPFNYSGVLTPEDEYKNMAEELIKLRLGER